ncbi:MAG: hypothetical protein KJ804_09445 [Proteobacteria bacterium]|nr:hypothetical protein [Pseudomonadota bacterium]MBU1058524.1 hypothetical protein [Pseudomonadota bacterium]
MKSSSLLSLALGVSWIFSPEALVIAGNVSGQMGWLIFPSLIGVVIVYMVCSRLLRSESLPSSPGWDFLVLQRGSGSIPATTLSLTACLPLTILAGTALLVTAGYTFNEVFLYWFPNFGFSFLLLGLLTTLQLFRKEYALWLQLCFSTLAMGGLLLLALYGIFSPDKQSTELLQQGSGFSLSSVSLLLLIFVGHTLSVDQRRSSFPLPLVMGFLLSGLWILASLGHVSPERLAASTIPYMTTAREILDDPGRQLMGIVIISGTCGALNGLMILTRNILTTLAREKTVPLFLSTQEKRWVLPFLLAAAIGTCMATGLAGNELLESLLRSALILWLLYYSSLCLSAVRWIQKVSASMPYPALFSTLLLMAGGITLIIDDPRRLEMGIFIFSVFFATSVLSTCWHFINKRQNPTGSP